MKCIFCGRATKDKETELCKTHKDILVKHNLLSTNKQYNINNLKNYFSKLITSKCKYCGESAHESGYCKEHYDFLVKSEVDINNDSLCFKVLNAEFYQKSHCLYCGSNHEVSNYFCLKHRTMLEQESIDLNDTYTCLRYLGTKLGKTRTYIPPDVVDGVVQNMVDKEKLTLHHTIVSLLIADRRKIPKSFFEYRKDMALKYNNIIQTFCKYCSIPLTPDEKDYCDLHKHKLDKMSVKNLNNAKECISKLEQYDKEHPFN